MERKLPAALLCEMGRTACLQRVPRCAGSGSSRFVNVFYRIIIALVVTGAYNSVYDDSHELGVKVEKFIMPRGQTEG